MIAKKEIKHQLTVFDIQYSLYMQNERHIVLKNSYIFCKTFRRYESDFAYITKAGYSHEIEIKRTYKDFLADFKKYGKHEDLKKGTCKQNYFSFCFFNKELADRCLPEIPKKYGVCYFGNSTINWIKAPDLLIKKTMDWRQIALRMAETYKTNVFMNELKRRQSCITCISKKH